MNELVFILWGLKVIFQVFFSCISELKKKDNINRLNLNLGRGGNIFLTIHYIPFDFTDPKVIHAIRKCPYLTKLLYLSCNPRAATNNFVE